MSMHSRETLAFQLKHFKIVTKSILFLIWINFEIQSDKNQLTASLNFEYMNLFHYCLIVIYAVEVPDFLVSYSIWKW